MTPAPTITTFASEEEPRAGCRCSEIDEVSVVGCRDRAGRAGIAGLDNGRSRQGGRAGKLDDADSIDGAPGDEILLAWTLTVVDANMHSQPFSAEYVFVQLLSPTREATIAFATGGDHARGEYVARVKVPAGGIAAIQFGIRGTTDSIIPLDGVVSIPAAAAKPVPASANAATGVPVLGSVLGPICLAGLGAVGMASRCRASSAPASALRGTQR